MMHTRLAYDKEPEVIDEYIAPIPRGEMPGLNDHKAYGPQRVHLLARRKIGNGGGATRASTNADSYAMLANCLWWWSVTGYFPGVPGYSNRAPVDINDNIPVSCMSISATRQICQQRISTAFSRPSSTATGMGAMIKTATTVSFLGRA
jgi:hypothetical protein